MKSQSKFSKKSLAKFVYLEIELDSRCLMESLSCTCVGLPKCLHPIVSTMRGMCWCAPFNLETNKIFAVYRSILVVWSQLRRFILPKKKLITISRYSG